MSADEVLLYPPVAYHAWWWVVIALCAVGIVAVVWWAVRALRTVRDVAEPHDLLSALRAETLSRIDALEASYAHGRITSAALHQRLSAEVRRFAGTATDGDADYQVLPQLRRAATKDVRLEPVADFVASVSATAFAPGPASAGPTAAEQCRRAREVITGWA